MSNQQKSDENEARFTITVRPLTLFSDEFKQHLRDSMDDETRAAMERLDAVTLPALRSHMENQLKQQLDALNLSAPPENDQSPT